MNKILTPNAFRNLPQTYREDILTWLETRNLDPDLVTEIQIWGSKILIKKIKDETLVGLVINDSYEYYNWIEIENIQDFPQYRYPTFLEKMSIAT